MLDECLLAIARLALIGSSRRPFCAKSCAAAMLLDYRRWQMLRTRCPMGKHDSEALIWKTKERISCDKKMTTVSSTLVNLRSDVGKSFRRFRTQDFSKLFAASADGRP